MSVATRAMILAGVLVSGLFQALPAWSAELVMLEQPGCLVQALERGNRHRLSENVGRPASAVAPRRYYRRLAAGPGRHTERADDANLHSGGRRR